ncbi:hypothetical protein M9458_020313, partial [Cirrhinus mrigala]
MYQSSPGGQSSCSSEPSPLGSATNNDSGVEMAMHSGGSLGDLSALDDTPVVDSTGSPGNSAGVCLQLRKNRGGLLHLENIKKEKLKTVRDPCSWANASPQVRNTKLPPIPSIDSLLETPNMGGQMPGPPTQRLGDLSSQLHEHDELSIHAQSSVLREASQFGVRNNNISSADSYDPISTDLQCGGAGGLTSLLNLTPAQHYRLKAKYAAATGGAPPTPLPNMDRMSLRTRMAFYNDSQEGLAHLHHSQGVVNSRRCSDTGYGAPGMMLHEVPANLPRRASDPVRRTAIDPLSLPRVQRFNSISNMTLSRLPAIDRRTFNLQSNTWSDGSLHRHPFSQRPPSISENVLMENMASDGGDQQEDDMVLPDDMVQYLKSQNGSSNQDPGISVNGGHGLDFHGNMPSQQQFYGQRRMGMASNNGSHVEPIVSAPEQMPNPQGMNKNNMPVQWNEVSSGSVDTTARLPKQQQLRGNLTVVQQKQNLGSYQGFGTNQQIIPMSQNLASLQQAYPQRATQRMNSVQQYRQSVTNPCQNLGEQANPQPGYRQELSYNSSQRLTCNGVGPPNGRAVQNQEMQNYRSNFSHMNNVNQQNYVPLTQTAVQNAGRGLIQPRPPPEPKPLNRQHSGSGMVQQNGCSLSNANSSEASPKRPADFGQHSNGNGTVYYSGEIHMLDSSVDYGSPMSPCANQAPVASVSTMASPGVNQVTSTVDSTQTLEHTQIDFDAILDDGDHSSLMSGTLSPGLLQSLSQNSSRLTTPRNSVTLASIPAGIGNMAIGDMSS